MTALGDSLQETIAADIYLRMEHNHNARFCKGDGATLNCRKPDARDLQPGQKLSDVFPWPGAANHESRLVDEIINEHTDLLMIASENAMQSVAPGRLDVSNDRRMQLAEHWGSMRDYYYERTAYDRGNTLAQMADYAWEYGHCVGFAGWLDTYRTEKKTITAPQFLAMFTAAIIAQAEQRAAEQGMELPEEEIALLEQDAAARFERALIGDVADGLVARLMEYDPEIEETEARRVISELKAGGEVEYFVPQMLASVPDVRALKPGLNVWYPWDTTRIKQAAWTVLSDWWTKVDLRARCCKLHGNDAWDAKAIEALIKRGPLTGTGTINRANIPSWVLSGGVIGQGIKEDLNQNGRAEKFQVYTFYYLSTGKGGVPALFKTVVAEGVDKPLFHACCEDAHGEMPFFDYVRERRAECLWESRGVGELSFSEQEEIRVQSNFCADNAALKIAPPVEVQANASGGTKIIKPRAQFPAARAGQKAITPLDLGGDALESLKVMENVKQRADNYWLRGMNVDPIARTNRWKRLVNDWLASQKVMERMCLQLIQQYAPDEIEIGALGGRVEELQLTKEDIQGEFSLQLEFDAGLMDPKTATERIKMFKEYISTMDPEGLMRNEQMLRLMLTMVNPSWAKLLVNPSAKAQQDDMNDVTDVLTAALNGVEKPYVTGKNHAARAQFIEQMLQMPALDDKGRALTGEDGQPVPNRMMRVIQENPDVAALVTNRLKFEQFQAQQMKNADTGRKGVKPIQPAA